MPLVLWAARALRAEVATVVAVVRQEDAALVDLLAEEDVRMTVCPDAHLGMGHSLAWGVRQTPDAGGWLIALGDMPALRPGTVQAIRDALRGPADIVVPTCRGQRGHPVAFGADYFAALAALQGDRGARDLVAAHAQACRELPVADPGVLLDVDRPGDLAAVDSAIAGR